VSEGVELRRETAGVEREPINQEAPGAELKEKDIEVPPKPRSRSSRSRRSSRSPRPTRSGSLER
jgi:hypothetical protein